MRKPALLSPGVCLLLALATTSEARSQDRAAPTQTILIAQSSSLDSTTLSVGMSDLGAARPDLWQVTPICPTAVACIVSDCAKTTSGNELSEMAGLDRESDPEPSTLAIWSLIGLCWAGAGWWRRRRQCLFEGGGRRTPMPNRFERRTDRPPWPEHVRTAIREVIERGGRR
jgi:hypothetical protein